jgi:hypothetical protein
MHLLTTCCADDSGALGSRFTVHTGYRAEATSAQPYPPSSEPRREGGPASPAGSCRSSRVRHQRVYVELTWVYIQPICARLKPSFQILVM